MAEELRILKALKTPVPAERPQVWVPGKIRCLSEVKSGHRIKIMAVRIADPARERLYAQGFLENRQGQILHNDHRGRVMLRLEGEIYLLGRLETAQIQVREYLLSR